MENFFNFAPQAGLFCGGILILLIIFSPMAGFLKSGIALIVGAIMLINFSYFAAKFAGMVDEIWKFYDWPNGFLDGISYHWDLIFRLYDYFNSPFEFAALISVFCIPLAMIFVRNSLLDRYLKNNLAALLLLGLPFNLVALYASYGLIVPYFFVVGILSIPFSPESPDSEEAIIEGKEVVRRTMNAVFMLKLQLLPFRQNGIKIHEYLRIPKKFESRGIIILGAPGSGKSHLIKTHFLPQLRKRKDLLVIYDYKGEFTQAFGEEKDTLILSPLDSRSAIWDIAKDVNTEAKALEFAKLIVQRDDSHHDSIFEDWSMDLITACLIKLQNEKGENWSFSDLYDGCQNLENLIVAVKKYRPSSNFSANFDGNSRQFEAIKGTIRSSMIRLEPLVRAWGTRSPERMFSISGWIKEHGGKKPTLILKYDPLYKESMGPFIANFLNFLFASILSLDDATGKNKDRRVWAVLDEFQILPKIPNLFEAARAGRSKGLRLLLGTQDLGQIDHMYKREGSRDTLINLLGFKLIGHLGSQGMQEFASGLLSKNKVLRIEKNVQRSGLQLSTTHSESEKTEVSVSSADFGAIPIPTAYNGALFWLVHQGWHPVKLRYLTKNIPNKYPSKVDEPWLLDKDRNIGQDKDVIEQREIPPSRREVSGATKLAPAVKKKFVGIDPNFSLDD